MAGACGNGDTADDEAAEAFAFIDLAGEGDALAGADVDRRVEAGILRVGLALPLVFSIAHLVEVGVSSAELPGVLLLRLSIWLFLPLLGLLALDHGLLGLQLLGEVLGLPLSLLCFDACVLQRPLDVLLHLQLRGLLLGELLGKILRCLPCGVSIYARLLHALLEGLLHLLLRGGALAAFDAIDLLRLLLLRLLNLGGALLLRLPRLHHRLLGVA